MGELVVREHYDEADYRAFGERLRESLEALEALLDRPGFGEGPPSIGAELELFLVDGDGRPLPANRDVLRRVADPRLTVELDRFNLECNSRPVALAGEPFSALAADLGGAVEAVRRAASGLGGGVVMIGILPTLREEDLLEGALTDLPRYRALSAGLRRLRRAPFEIHIDGPEPLRLRCDDVTLEGANTSLQVHLRVAPADFAHVFNAAQMAVAPVLATAANAPFFLGHRLWDETRVALFKQSVDPRASRDGTYPVARVSFGHGWVRRSALELFAESVALHPPLLPMLGDERPARVVAAGGTPRLRELRLHQGTVWSWNRPVYDPTGGGHLRIEMRALPAGPTLADMMANTAFLVGLAFGLAPQVPRLVPAFPFACAERNFYRAARHGPEAVLLWPSREAPSPRPIGALELAGALLPVAERGLRAAGVRGSEIGGWLGVIEGRLAAGQSGARWQDRALVGEEAAGSDGRFEALARMLGRYRELSEEGRPVHTWRCERP